MCVPSVSSRERTTQRLSLFISTKPKSDFLTHKNEVVIRRLAQVCTNAISRDEDELHKCNCVFLRNSVLMIDRYIFW